MPYSPWDLLYPGIEPASLVSPALQVDSLPLSHWGSLTYQALSSNSMNQAPYRYHLQSAN